MSRRPSPAGAGVRCRRGIGLIELLTVVAVLIVALALVVATARHVRASSANELTRKRIQALVDDATRLIVRGDVNPTLPIPYELDANAAALGNGADDRPDSERPANLNLVEAALQAYARAGAERLKDLLAEEAAAPVADSAAAPTLVDAARKPAAALAGAAELRDAWGRPIALMPRQLPALGIAPDDGPFFVSAGPDGAFLTLADNLYSYDLPALLPRLAPPGRRPAVAGHRE